MVSVISLLDYLRETFSPDARISYGRRFEEVKKAPLLILDGLGTENPTDWAKEKVVPAAGLPLRHPVADGNYHCQYA